MITTAPLPSLTGLLAFGAEEDSATRKWCRAGDQALLVSRSAWSLALLAGLIEGRPARVLLPAWFCGQSLLPLRATGAELTFAPVDETGAALWPAGEFDMVVVVHTLGRPADVAAARAAFPDALLVEDGAHALGPVAGIGEGGDVVFYSPHKTLGLPEGAVLVCRKPGLADRLRPALPPAPSPARWAVKRLVQRMLPDAARARVPVGGPAEFLLDPPAGEPAPATQVSSLARALMAGAQLPREAALRRLNALALRAALDLPKCRPFLAEEPAAPYRFVLDCDDASALYARLRAARLPAESWPDMVPEVAAEPQRYGAAAQLRRRLLYLPVHSALPQGYARLYREALDAR